MAIPVVESFSIGTYAQDGATCTVTKPTGLAVGDMMCAMAISHSDSGTAPTVTPPAGWSTYTSYTDESFMIQYVFYKVADSADVAASNFSFTHSGTNTRVQVGIARISGAPSTLATGNATGHITTPTSVSSFTISLDLTYNDVLLLAQIVGRDATQVRTFSSYSVSGTNPTWTEHADSSNNDSVDTSFAIASAGIATPRTLTNFSATASGTLEDTYLILIAIPGVVSATGSNEFMSVSPTFFSGTASVGTTGTNALHQPAPAFPEPVTQVIQPTVWTPITKN